MYCVKNVTDDIYWIGANDRRIALFENVFPVPRGVSYNSYLLIDEKTVLLDTVDRAVGGQFFENINHVLDGRKLDYIVVNHMEPDHAATLFDTTLRYPEATVICNQKTLTMMRQFFDFNEDERIQLVKEGDVLSTGKHELTFVMAPMVHWPEVMVTYDMTDRVLFSADAFGTFGALDGNIFADELRFERDWLDDARRYYTNIVGKYGTQVQTLLQKSAKLDIGYICPLHGPIWRKDISWFIEKYQKWSTYTPEENAVMIAYASVYGDTENAASILAGKLSDGGVKNIVMYDVSVTHPSVIVAEAFRCSHLVFASTTYNAGIFCNMETALMDLKAHNLQNRTIAILENGSWAPTAGNLMREIFSGMKNMTILENGVTIRSAVKQEQLSAIESMAAEMIKTLACDAAPILHEEKIEKNAMFALSYGLFVLTAREGEKDNGCIINTVMQITDTPKRISIAVNKANYTHDMIDRTGVFNVSVLSTDAPFAVFQQFGFCSGRDTDKFADNQNLQRSDNGIIYVPEYANAYISGKVIERNDYGTHTVFVAEVTQAVVLSRTPSVTYAYYFEHIKPKPQLTAEKKKGWVCKICGYVYEGEVLPPDFICPLCKHGVEDFEPIG